MVSNYKDEFLKIFRENITRAGSDELLWWIEDTDFFAAPASTRFHGSNAGGLCEHSVRVFHRLKLMANALATEIPGYSDETLAIVALCHDLCKCQFYKPGYRNVKDDATGRWERVPTFTVEEAFPFGGHGSKSVYLVQKFLKLTDEEAVAINCHMGFADQKDMSSVSKAYETYPLAWMLHAADEMATYIDKV